jgi:serine/threonine-protein kinase
VGETTTSAYTSSHTEHDLWSVFREQEDTSEVAIYRWFFILSAASLFLPTFSTFVLGRSLEQNAPFFFVAGGAVAWSGFAFALRRKGKLIGPLRIGTVLVLGILPWTIMATYVARFNMPRAITTWEPIILFTAPVALSILWRRPWVPLMLSAVGAVSYTTLYFITVPPSTWESIEASSALRPSVTIYRVGLLLFVGVFCWRGAQMFRGALLQGARTMRARDLFGKYRLQEPIGRGGMGSVVKAVYCPEGGFERPVAIKRVLGDLAKSARTIKQFRAEAELGSRLNHPNIVAVLDFGRVDDTYFFAMEYVDGYSLAELLEMAREAKVDLPPAFAARVGLEVCAGLQHAHAEAVDAEGSPLRVVHRDLSPHNILIARSGQVKITDFGIARVLGEAEAERTSRVVGKLAYMAPEVVQAGAFDTRADLYSFGVILWEMLTGERLFQRDNSAAAALAALEAVVPPPSSKRPKLHAQWNDICARVLAREVEDRVPDAAELSALLLERLGAEGDPEGDEIRLVVRHLEDLADAAYASEVERTDATLTDPTRDSTSPSR